MDLFQIARLSKYIYIYVYTSYQSAICSRSAVCGLRLSDTGFITARCLLSNNSLILQSIKTEIFFFERIFRNIQGPMYSLLHHHRISPRIPNFLFTIWTIRQHHSPLDFYFYQCHHWNHWFHFLRALSILDSSSYISHRVPKFSPHHLNH